MANWDGSQPAQNPWKQQTDNRHFPAVPRVEESQMSSVFSTTSGYQNVQLVAQSMNVSITLDKGTLLQSINGPAGVESLQHNTSGLDINASMRDALDDGVGAQPHQLAAETRTLHMTQMPNASKSGRDIGGETLLSRLNESSMDVSTSGDLNDITRIFDDDIDVTIINSRAEGTPQTTEEYALTTIEPHRLWTHAADSPASFDVPTDIFHALSRSASESCDSLFTPSPFPGPGPVRRRVIMSYVAVPPFSRGLGPSKYRPVPCPKTRPIRPDVQTHTVAMNNNGVLHAISSQKRIRAESRAESVASSRPPTEMVKKRLKPEEKERETEKGAEVVQYRWDVGGERAPSVAASDTTRRTLLRSRRHEFGYASYDSELDLVHLAICGIPYDLHDVVSANTRFLREAERVHAIPKTSWGCYSTKADADADDYAYTRKWSSTCESLQGIEEMLSVGECWLGVDGSDAECEEEMVQEEEAMQEEEVDDQDDEIMFIGRSGPSQSHPQLPLPKKVVSKPARSTRISNHTIRAGTPVNNDEDDEIMFIGRSGPSQSHPQLPLPKKAVSRPVKSTGVPNRTTRAGTSVDNNDEAEIFEVSSPKPRPKPKPKTRPRTDSSTSLGQVGSFRPRAKPVEGGRAIPPESPHSISRLRMISRDYPPTQSQQVVRKRPRADDDDEEHYRPSAKVLGKRRATSPGPQDPAGVQRVRHPLRTSLSKSHCEPTKKSKTPKTPNRIFKSLSKSRELLVMANIIANTMNSYPPPPQIFSDPLVSLSSPNESTPTPQLTNTATTETLSTGYNPPTPPSDHFTLDSTAIVNSFSDFLVPHTSSSPFLSYAMARGGDGPFLAGDSYLYSPTENIDLPSLEKQVEANSSEWSPGNGTIDPALLGGHPTETQKLRALSPPSPAVSSAYLTLVAYDSDTPSASPSPPPQPNQSSHQSQSPPRSLHSPSPPLGRLTPSSLKSSPAGHHANDPSDTAPRPARVPQQPRVPDGMVVTPDLHLDGDSDQEWSFAGGKRPRKKAKVKRVVRPRPDAADDAASDYEEGSSSNLKAIVVKKRLVSAVAKPKTKPSPRTNWPLDPKDDYCHQCRCKSFYRKHICACARKYCIRCLSIRYDTTLFPSLEGFKLFVRYDDKLAYTFSCSTFKCPYCRGMCTCDICTKKRGEVYIPLKKGRANKVSVEHPAIRVAENERASDLVTSASARPRPGGETNLPAPTISGPVQYWATIYGMDGERIGNAFVGNDNEDFVLPRFLEDASAPQPRSRVYVGETQKSWGLGAQHFVKELNPVPWYEKNNGPNERIYVGAKAPLSWLTRKKSKAPSRPNMEPLSFDRFSSPLSSLRDSEDDENINETGTGEGESHQGLGPHIAGANFEMAVQEDIDNFLAKGPSDGFSPNSLADTDVARAISLGLLACGMGVQLSGC
ncbi:hypothetical protein C0995_009646 [Termitomyces sp. Mi166|nr:hypothetical protein C0995_009646 [Termitomyces sp. Mi166\